MFARFSAMMALMAGGAMVGFLPSSAQALASAATAQEQKTINASKGAVKALSELQQAVHAKDVANIPAKVAAAQAVVQTPEDRFILAGLRYQAAADAQDPATAAAAAAELLASGLVSEENRLPLLREHGVLRYRLKQFDQAVPALEKFVAERPSDFDTRILLAEAQANLGKKAEALTTLRQAIAATTAAGARAKEAWYKRAVAIAYQEKMPAAMELSRDWVRAYPTAANWRDAIGIYTNMAKPDEDHRLSLLRLAHANGALNSASDYEQLAYLSLTGGFPAETQAVLDAGVAAGTIDTAKTPFKELAAEAKLKAAADKTSVAEAVAAGKDARSAKIAVTHGDLLYGLNRYAEAADVYRAALGKPGADADAINLKLGMALARAGDKAAAIVALNAAGGSRSEIAKYWLLYLDTRS